ncbi:MAG: ABC transporter ATP-binding protein [Actinobacteria bacterium]|nr:ABC transporter ATP-binding protein [Actinomycetota bacterium]
MKLALTRFRVEYDGCPVVVGLDEVVGSGEWLCVIGPNGAGKSSLLRALAGLVASSGHARIGEHDVANCTPREAARLVAFVPQDPVLPDDMSVYDYVMLGRNLDLGHQQRALELVDKLRRERGITVVSAMHDLTLAGLYADRLLLLHQGVAVARGDARAVLRSETLAEFYGISARVIHESDGTVVVVPQRVAGEL